MRFNDTLMNAVDGDIRAGLIPMLIGEPGIGKSSWVMALGHRNGTQVFVLPCNQLADKADLTGARLVPVDEDKKEFMMVFYPHSVIMQAIKYAEEHPNEEPILFMDELNRTTPDVTSECLSIPTLRAIGNKKLPTNLRVVTAGNDKGNITALDEASISRFVLYNVEPDVDTFLSLDPELNPFIKTTLEKHPETIFCKAMQNVIGAQSDDDDDAANNIDELIDDSDDMSQLTTPRTISGLSKWLNLFTNDQLVGMLAEMETVNGADKSVLQTIIEGHVGATTFAAFLLAEIAANVSTTNNQANAVNVVKPQKYDALKSCQTVSDVENFVANLNDNEKSACLVYALYERTDNAVYIQKIATEINVLAPADMQTLMLLIVNSNLGTDNVDTLLAIQCPLVSALDHMFQAMPRG